MIKLLRSVMAGLLAAAIMLPAQADEAAGKYSMVRPPQPTNDPTKIEVVFVFWYGAPHAYSMLPFEEDFIASAASDVDIVHMPAIFRESWLPHARLYYTGELLGVADSLHRSAFEAVHENNQPLKTKQAIQAFTAAHGISQDDFAKTYDSFAVETLVRKSMVMQGKYGVQGVPSVIVNGKYRTAGSLAGSYYEMFKVINVLIERERNSNK